MLNFLYEAIAKIILAIHAALSYVLDPDGGAAWALSIVLLTVAMRLLLFPLFVKQIRSQRAMQALQPKMKALQAKHKGDRETLNREMMALYREHGANPLASILPLLLQLPVFFALFHVLDHIKPDRTATGYVFRATSGISRDLVESAARAKIFGAPISAAYTSPTRLLTELGGSAASVKVLAVVMIVLMGATTFVTQKQMMARSGPLDPTQARMQKFLLYVLPFSFALFGFRFPLGVLLYWLTTNLWSMGQQAVVLHRMPPVIAGAPLPTASKPAVASGKPVQAAAPARPPVRPANAGVASTAPATAPAGASLQAASGGAAAAAGNGARRRQGSTRAKRRGGRRGGRH